MQWHELCQCSCTDVRYSVEGADSAYGEGPMKSPEESFDGLLFRSFTPDSCCICNGGFDDSVVNRLDIRGVDSPCRTYEFAKVLESPTCLFDDVLGVMREMQVAVQDDSKQLYVRMEWDLMSIHPDFNDL